MFNKHCCRFFLLRRWEDQSVSLPFIGLGTLKESAKGRERGEDKDSARWAFNAHSETQNHHIILHVSSDRILQKEALVSPVISTHYFSLHTINLNRQRFNGCPKTQPLTGHLCRKHSHYSLLFATVYVYKLKQKSEGVQTKSPMLILHESMLRVQISQLRVCLSQKSRERIGALSAPRCGI